MIRNRIVISLLFLAIVYLIGACSNAASEELSPSTVPSPAEREGSRVSESLPTDSGVQIQIPDKVSEGNNSDLVVIVNGQGIDRLTFERQVARFQAAMIGQGYSFSGEEGKEAARQVRKQVLEAMIDQLLIEQAAAAAGIVVDEEELRRRVQADIDAGGGEEQFKEWLRMNGLTMEEYEGMMRSTWLTEQLIARLSTTLPETIPQVRFRQILVATEAEAKEVRAKLDAGANFADLARQYSLDEGSRAQGGDRGYLPLGRSVIPAEIEEAIRNLAAGEVAGPIATSYGYYVVQVVDAGQARPLSAEMQQGLTQEAFLDWIQAERRKASIQRIINLDN